MSYKEEFKNSKTVHGWSEEEIDNGEACEFVELSLKDIRGKASLQEKVAIRIDDLLKYNNIDYISKEEIFEKANDIIKLIKDEEV